MGHRMEIYLSPEKANEVIAVARNFGIEAQIVGRVEESDSPKVTIKSDKGVFTY